MEKRQRLLRKSLEYSATVSQLKFRWNQLQGWPRMFRQLRTEKDPVARKRTELSFYTSLSIVFLDILVGAIIAVTILYKPHAIFEPIQKAYLYLNNHILQSVVSWLMGSPAGLQMNRNLVVFLGTVSLTVVSYWDAVILGLITSDYIDMEFRIAIVLCIFSFAGLSLLLSALIDFSSIAFFHIFFVYAGLTRLWNLTVRIIFTFTQLFRGKKYNILKLRVDGHEFDIEQLILGTVFLSVVVFLLPTVMVCYLSFMLLWMGVLLLQLLLRAGVSVFSFFPVYLYWKSGSIPSKNAVVPRSNKDGSMRFEIRAQKLGRAAVVSEFLRAVLASIPINEPISSTLMAVVRGTTLVFPKYAQHEQINNSVGFGPSYTKLIRRISPSP
jgi:phosphatidylinositol glycan class Q protein